MRLTTRFVQSAKPGRYHDYQRTGLSLLVKKSGRKYWTQQITVNGKRINKGLGNAEYVSLQEAREKAWGNFTAVRKGTWEEHAGLIPSFEKAAEEVILLNRDNWKDGGKTEQNWHNTLQTYAFPTIGTLPVNRIRASHILSILEPIWIAKRPTAKKVKHRINAVLAWSVAQEYRKDNPMTEVTAALPKNGHTVKHMRALPHTKVKQAVKTIRKSGAYEITKLALEFTVLTACRSGEVRGAQWNEIDFDSATWTVPDSRMKMNREHKVPLSARALEILHRAKELAVNEHVFPSVRGGILSDNTMSKLLRDNKIESTVHGFRSSFRDWSAEKSEAPREVCEFCLAHVEGSAAELAYRRTDYFDMRREIMQAWCDYLAS